MGGYSVKSCCSHEWYWVLVQVLQGGPSKPELLKHPSKNKRDMAESISHIGERSTLSTFVLPQLLGVILKLMVGCDDMLLRMEILKDILRLLKANPANSEALTMVCVVSSSIFPISFCIILQLIFWSPFGFINVIDISLHLGCMQHSGVWIPWKSNLFGCILGPLILAFWCQNEFWPQNFFLWFFYCALAIWSQSILWHL